MKVQDSRNCTVQLPDVVIVDEKNTNIIRKKQCRTDGSSNDNNDNVGNDKAPQILVEQLLSDDITTTTSTSSSNSSTSKDESQLHEQQHQQQGTGNEEGINSDSNIDDDDKKPSVVEVISNNRRRECIYTKHIPMIGRTTDPALLEYDIAVQQFHLGVACARQGDYVRAQEYICSAFLINENAIQHVQSLPNALLSDEYDDASVHIMEHALFHKLLNYNKHHTDNNIILKLLLQMCAGAILGDPSDEGKKRYITNAIKSGEKLLHLYDKQWTEERDDTSIDNAHEDDDIFSSNSNSKAILHGSLQRWRVHRQLSALQGMVGNYLMAYSELDAALQTAVEIHHVCQVKYDIASFCMSTHLLKSNIDCFNIFYQIINDTVIINKLHDTKYLPTCYAYMAMIGAKNPTKLPSYVTPMDVFMYMEESDRCQRRYEQLHCLQTGLDHISVHRLKIKMEFLKSVANQNHMILWKAFSSINAMKNSSNKNKEANVQGAANITWTYKRQTHCLTCHREQESDTNGSVSETNSPASSCDNNNKNSNVCLLSKCTRCKNAFYCSKQCQTKDWIIHKNYCKQLSGTL